MSWIAVAVAAVQVGSSIYGANKAAGAMKDSANANAQVSQNIYNQQRADLQPWRQVGGSALNAYARAMGLPQSDQVDDGGPSQYQFSQSGKATPYDVIMAYQMYRPGEKPSQKVIDYYTGRERADQLYGDIVAPGMKAQQSSRPQEGDEDRYGGFYASPGYQFRLDEGQQGLDRNMASRGLLNSGARGKALTRYNQGVAADEFGNYTNRLSALAGLGQTATDQTNAYASSYAGNQMNANTNAGLSRASGYLGTTGAISSGVNNVLGALPWLQNPGGKAGNPAPPNSVYGQMNDQYFPRR